MLLQKITLVDFGIYGQRNEFDLASTSERPIILCGGTNGAGKTTLFESVSLCLYGQNSIEPRITQKKYHKRIMRSFHRYGRTKKSAEEASITLDFQYAHEGKITEYRITRMWQNNKGKIDETLYIKKRNTGEKDHVSLDSVEQSLWQSFVDHMLPKGITKLFFFDGEKIQDIAESGNEDRHIKSSFDSLLGLDLINQLYDDVGLYMLRNSGGETASILQDIERKTVEKNEAESKLDGLKEKQVFLQSEITSKTKDLELLEEKFVRLGGVFAERRQDLMIKRAKLESRLAEIENEIRSICSDTLPFCLIPKQLGNIRTEIKADILKIRNSFERKILDDAFAEVASNIKKEIKYNKKTKDDILATIQGIMNEKIKSLTDSRQLTFNLSLEDMESMIRLIDDINKFDRKEIAEMTREYDSLTGSLGKIKSSLDVSPQQDEIGPLFSKIKGLTEEIAVLKHELEQLGTLESQEKSMIVMLNAKIRESLTKNKFDKRRLAGLEMAPKIQEVLEEYAKSLRLKKVELLESNILDGITKLFHKKDFINKISIDPQTFAVTLYRDEEEITKEMLSKGELQIYATAIVWGLARTSGRPLPFIIDTPLARLDVEHRENLVANFYPFASHQTIIFSTNSEIIEPYHEQLKPYISRDFLIKYDSEKDRTLQNEGYFFEKKEDKIEV